MDVDDFAVLQLAFGGQGVPPPYFVRTDATYYHDADGDNDVDMDDAASFLACLGATDAQCLGMHDFDNMGVSDGQITLLVDWASFQNCSSGSGVIPPEFCVRSTFEGSVPTTGSFTLHGRPIDVLSDGKTLTYVRARYYDAKNARWLQRDPKGNVDGPNLYEAFRGNAVSNLDPMGTELWVREDEKAPLETFFGKDNVTFTLVENGMFSVAVRDSGFRSLGDYTRLNNGSARYAARLSEAILTPFYRWEGGLDAFNRGLGRKWIGQQFENRSLPGLPPNMVVAAPDESFGLAKINGFSVPIISYNLTSEYAFRSVVADLPKIALTVVAAAALIDPIPGDEAIIGGAAFSTAGRSAASRASVLLRRLRQAGGELTVTRGTITTRDIAALSRLSNNEFVLVRIGGRTGPRVLIEGTPATTNFPVNSRLILQTQPGITAMAARPSPLDRITLTETRGGLGQRSSVSITFEGNFGVRFGPNPALDNPVVPINVP